MLRRGELSQAGWGGEEPDSKELHGMMPFLGVSKKNGGFLGLNSGGGYSCWVAVTMRSPRGLWGLW